MNKKGFTLIELLAVIAVLAIILIIAIPNVIEIVSSVKENVNAKNEALLIKTAKNYLYANQTLVPSTIGSKREISLNDLVTGGYVKQIKNAKGSNDCDGYVIVTKINVNDYSYSPYLDCTSTSIGSSVENKLALHYTFEDYEEATENLLPSPVGNGSWSNGYVTTILNNAIAPDGTNTATRVTTTTSGQARTEYNIPSPTIDTYYTFSVYAKRGSTPYAALYTYFTPYADPAAVFNLDTGLLTYSANTISTSITNEGDGWYRISMTVLVKPDQTYRLMKIIQTSSATSVSSGTVGDYVYYWNAQVEKKTYTTPYTQTVRTPNITDYSLNSNVSTLQALTTPKWTNNSIKNDGAYEFNGSTTSITLPNDIVTTANIRTTGVTYSAWVKLNAITDGRIVGQQPGNGYSDYASGGLGVNGSGNAMMIAYSDTAPIGYMYATSATTLQTNTWYNIVGTFDTSTNLISVYVNGKLDGTTQTIGSFSRLLTNASNRIGNKDNTTTYPFNGIIDDIKIYNRTLSVEEIKYNYELKQ